MERGQNKKIEIFGVKCQNLKFSKNWNFEPEKLKFCSIYWMLMEKVVWIVKWVNSSVESPMKKSKLENDEF